jgi:hypothetical protein
MLRFLFACAGSAFLTLTAQGISTWLDVSDFGFSLWGSMWTIEHGNLRSLLVRFITYGSVFSFFSFLITFIGGRFSFLLVAVSALYITIDNATKMRFDDIPRFWHKVEVYALLEFPYLIPIPVMLGTHFFYRRYVQEIGAR